jgi:hypothetical protein
MESSTDPTEQEEKKAGEGAEGGKKAEEGAETDKKGAEGSDDEKEGEESPQDAFFVWVKAHFKPIMVRRSLV